MRILVAEDDPVSRKLLEALLTKWGYDVTVTSNGEDAWRVLQDDDGPKLAILDWMMPGRDGVQVCRDVRKHKNESYTYLLLLTAKSQKQDIIEGMNAGADDYLTKPFDANELRVRLRAGRRILDLQAELLSVKEALRQQATHDPLTGLPNRLLFSDRLTQRLAQARRNDRPVAVMFLDLDRFKMINDTLGHSTGDLLLKAVAQRLTESLREVDTIARMGGDEFTIILSDMAGAEDAAAIAQRVLDAFEERFSVEGHDLFITTSIGISLYPSDGENVETLVKNADAAMYRAKEQGRNNYQLYTEELNATVLERMKMDNSLRKAVEREEFVLHYQPRVDMKTGKILGVEALVRWQHPDLGLIPPAQFIPLAEETGLIVPMSEWVMRTACRQNKEWQDAGLAPIPVAVNISSRQFQQEDLLPTVKRVLEETGLDPQYLDMELTESTLMRNPDAALRILADLKSVGLRVSIDDFGTGFSSLSYLNGLPIDALKIDLSFITDITTNPDSAAIAGAIVAMAHSLKLRVIAEGVETLEQLEFLKSLNCDEIQGYFVSRPTASGDLEQMLRDPRYQSADSILPAA